MFDEKEKAFLDAVVQRYCMPPATCIYTPTVMEAAYSVAVRQGRNIPAGDMEREAFFDGFMGGLMHRADAKSYIASEIQAFEEHQEQSRIDMKERQAVAREAALEHLSAIMKAAYEIQRLTANIGGCYRIFAEHSAELDMLRDVERRISHIGK